MRKFLSLLFICIIILSLCSCNDNQNTANEQNSQVTINSINDIRHDFNEASKQHSIFFGLLDSNKNYTAMSGVATITIADMSDNQLYSQNITFAEKDFFERTTNYSDNTKLLCELVINNDDISPSISEVGTLTLNVNLSDGTCFNQSYLSIGDLPEKKININLPELPKKVTDTPFKEEPINCEVIDIEYTSDIDSDNKASVDMEVVLKFISQKDYDNKSKGVTIAYKLVDTEDIIVDSGIISFPKFRLGEKAKSSTRFSDLNPECEYKLIFENYK